ncbi:MAG: hypothetical protein RR842_08680 [Gordonibacter sp.]|uniref:hypothetical protein n=1 Tax=Gordonibacter sp. TaxID=1968902 RepID=UPI002FC597A7
MGWKFRKTLCTLEKLRENEKFAQHLFENKLGLPLATCAMLALTCLSQAPPVNVPSGSLLPTELRGR